MNFPMADVIYLSVRSARKLTFTLIHLTIVYCVELDEAGVFTVWVSPLPPSVTPLLGAD